MSTALRRSSTRSDQRVVKREQVARAVVAEGLGMTDNKARKVLVRQRMAHTGESYTTAHRHVTARRAANSIAGVVPGYPAFGVEHHHPSALSRHLLAQAGLDISEPMACGLGGGIGFLYAVFEYRSVPYPMLTIVAQHHPEPWFDAVTRNLGVVTDTSRSSAPRTALDRLDAALDAGKPALIVVGRGRLPWNASTSEEEAADAYPVVAAGRVGDQYLLDDGTDQPRRIDGATLGIAWAAQRKGRFALTTVAELPRPVNLDAAVRSALTMTVDHLTGPVLGNYFDANMGFSGLSRFVRDLRDTTTKTGWQRRFSDPLAFTTAMRRLAKCLTWQHTAAGATRLLYAQFLTEAAELTALPLVPAAHSARQAGEIWTHIADVAGSATAQDNPRLVFDAIAELAAAALDTETRLAAQIRDALR